MSFFENILLVIVAFAGACAALWAAYGMVKALRYLIEWYEDRKYAKLAAAKYQEFQRYSGQQLLEQFRRNHAHKD